MRDGTYWVCGVCLCGGRQRREHWLPPEGRLDTPRLSTAAVYIKILPVYIRVNDLRGALVCFYLSAACTCFLVSCHLFMELQQRGISINRAFPEYKVVQLNIYNRLKSSRRIKVLETPTLARPALKQRCVILTHKNHTFYLSLCLFSIHILQLRELNARFSFRACVMFYDTAACLLNLLCLHRDSFPSLFFQALVNDKKNLGMQQYQNLTIR